MQPPSHPGENIASSSSSSASDPSKTSKPNLRQILIKIIQFARKAGRWLRRNWIPIVAGALVSYLLSRRRIRSMAFRMSALAGVLKKAQLELQDVKRQSSEAIAQNKSREKEVSMLKKEAGKLSAVVDQSEHSIASLRSEVKDKEIALQDALADRDRLESQIQFVQRELQQRTNSGGSQNEIIELRESLRKARLARAALDRALQSADRDVHTRVSHSLRDFGYDDSAPDPDAALDDPIRSLLGNSWPHPSHHDNENSPTITAAESLDSATSLAPQPQPAAPTIRMGETVTPQGQHRLALMQQRMNNSQQQQQQQNFGAPENNPAPRPHTLNIPKVEHSRAYIPPRMSDNTQQQQPSQTPQQPSSGPRTFGSAARQQQQQRNPLQQRSGTSYSRLPFPSRMPPNGGTGAAPPRLNLRDRILAQRNAKQ